jgi:hypothetical protein
MSIEAAIYARLSAAPPIGATVSVGQRLQGTVLPAVTFEAEEIDAIRTFSGTAGLYAARIRCACLANTYKDAKALSKTVRDRLSGWAATVQGVVVVAVRHVSDQPMELMPGEGEEDLPAQVDVNFNVHYSEAP